MAHPQKILYVIGDAAASVCRKRLLEKGGYTVVCIRNGKLAQAMLQSRPIDLILLDFAATPPIENIALDVRKTCSQVPIVVICYQDLLIRDSHAWADAFVHNPTNLLATVTNMLTA